MRRPPAGRSPTGPTIPGPLPAPDARSCARRRRPPAAARSSSTTTARWCRCAARPARGHARARRSRARSRRWRGVPGDDGRARVGAERAATWSAGSGASPDVWLVAEHGALLRAARRARVAARCGPGRRPAWMDAVRPVLEHFVDRTPGSFIEEKEFALVWHYRLAEPEFGAVDRERAGGQPRGAARRHRAARSCAAARWSRCGSRGRTRARSRRTCARIHEPELRAGAWATTAPTRTCSSGWGRTR